MIHASALAVLLAMTWSVRGLAAPDEAPQPKGPGPGEITTGRYVAGGLVGTFAGFGIGHAIQKRFLFRGLAFCLIEASALHLVILSPEDDERSINLGFSVYLITHIVEGIEVWVGPTHAFPYWQVGPTYSRERKAPALALSLTI